MPKPQLPEIPPTRSASFLESQRESSASQSLTLRLVLEVYRPKKGGYRAVPGAVWTGRWHGTGGQPTAVALLSRLARVWWMWFPPPAVFYYGERLEGGGAAQQASVAAADGDDDCLERAEQALQFLAQYRELRPEVYDELRPHASALSQLVKRYRAVR